MNKVKFVTQDKSEFFATLKKRVDNYFSENNISKNANTAMYFKSAFFVGGILLFYFLIFSGYFSLWQMLCFAILLGTFQAFTAFNISHDAIHGAYSSSQKVNKILGLSFNFLGANAYMWSIQHNVAHHTYTNIPRHDEDTEVAKGILRLSPADKRRPIMKYQHIYAFFLYCFASISWVFRKDYVKFFQKKIGESINTSNHPKEEVFNLFFYKAVYYFIFIVAPLLWLDVTFGQFLIGFLMMHIAEGFVLGMVFQLAHVVEGTSFPEPDSQGNIKEAWAVHQMQTTANFARKNWLTNFLCGGLNMQIEHHLFPNICHIHYADISDIVRQTAEEFNIPYIENPTFFAALKSHYNVLKKLGREGVLNMKYEMRKI